MYNLFIIYNIIAITAADQRISKASAKDRSINLALETVLEFNDKNNADINMLDNMEKLINKIKMAINKNKLPQRVHVNKGVNTFSSFIQSAINILNKYEDKALQYFVSIINDEINNNYDGNKFYELTENNNLRRLLDNNFSLLKNQTASDIRRDFKMIAREMQRGGHNKKVKEIINFINSLYGRDSIKKYYDFLYNLDDYRMNRNNHKKLSKIVKDGMRFLIFDHYSQLSDNSRNKLISMIYDLLEHTKEPYTKLSRSTISFKYAPTVRAKADKEEPRTFRQIYFEKNLDLKYDPNAYGHLKTKIKNEHNKLNSAYSFKFTTSKSGINLIKTRVPPNKHYIKYKIHNYDFKKSNLGSLKTGRDIKTTKPIQTFRQMYVEKNLDLKYDPYAYDHLTTKSKGKAKKITLPTLYTSFDLHKQSQLAASKRHFTGSSRDFTKGKYQSDTILNKSNTPTPRDNKVIEITGEYNTSLGVKMVTLPILNKQRSTQKLRMVPLNIYKKYLKRLKLHSRTSKISLIEPTQLLPETEQKPLKMNISKEYLYNSNIFNKLISNNKLKDKNKLILNNTIKGNLTNSVTNSSKGFSVENIITVTHKKPSRRHYNYVTTFTTAIHQEVFLQLQKLENDLKRIKTQLKKHIVTSNKSFNQKHYANEFYSKEFNLDGKTKITTETFKMNSESDVMEDKTYKANVQKQRGDRYNAGYSNENKMSKVTSYINIIKQRTGSRLRTERINKAVTNSEKKKMYSNDDKVELYKVDKSHTVRMPPVLPINLQIDNQEKNKGYINTDKKYISSATLLESKKTEMPYNNALKNDFTNHFRSNVNLKGPSQSILTNSIEKSNVSDFQSFRDTNEMNQKNLFNATEHKNIFNKNHTNNYENSPNFTKIFRIIKNNDNATNILNEDIDDKNISTEILMQKSYKKTFDSTKSQTTNVNVTKNEILKAAISSKNVSSSSARISNVTEMGFNNNRVIFNNFNEKLTSNFIFNAM